MFQPFAFPAPILLHQINDLQPDDSATYECQLFVSTSWKIKDHVELRIRTPAQVDSTDVVVIAGANGGSLASSNQPPELNQTIELRCKARGYPRPTLHWYRDGDALLPGGTSKYMGSVLTLVNIQPQDRGQYYCQAENGIGGPHRSLVQLEIRFPPLARTQRPRVAQAVGYDIELQCIVEASPSPEVKWFKRNAAGQSSMLPLYDEDIVVENNAGINDVTVSVLRIRNVRSKDYGIYSCRAYNSIGSAESVLELYSKCDCDRIVTL